MSEVSRPKGSGLTVKMTNTTQLLNKYCCLVKMEQNYTPSAYHTLGQSVTKGTGYLVGFTVFYTN